MTNEEIAELEKKAHAYDSERGRLQKAQLELDGERAKRAELEQALAAAQSHSSASQIDPKAVEVFGEDGVSMLQNMLTPVLQKLDAVGKRFEERDQSESQARAAQKYWQDLDVTLTDNNLPGFASRLRDGDLSSAWADFVAKRPSINRGQAEGDIATVSDAISMFINQHKELVAGGGYSPRSVSGGASAVRSDYSDADYVRDRNALQTQLNNLMITEAVYTQKMDELFVRYQTAAEKAEKATAAFGLA